MKPIIDIHSHILPGVDDGCQSKLEALAMLSMYEEQNVEAVICTPHFGPCAIPGADVEGAYKWLCSKSSSVKLYLGCEALVGSFTPELDIGGPHGPRQMAGTRVILLEFDEWGSVHTDADHIVFMISGFEHFCCPVILAHAERYRSLQENPKAYRDILRTGARLQINAYDVYDTQTEVTKITTRWLLENRMVSFIGSDAHGAAKRKPVLKNGVQWIYDNCPEDYADAIVHDNAAELIRKGYEYSTKGILSEQWLPMV